MPVGDGLSVLRGEIFEQPAAVARLLERERRNAAALAAIWRRANVPFVLIAARGTSDNAARYAQYAFGLASRLPVALAAPSLVTLYGVPPRLRGALVIGISMGPWLIRKLREFQIGQHRIMFLFFCSRFTGCHNRP